MKTILIATDFSANAYAAFHYAACLTASVKGRLILFYNNLFPIWMPEESGWPDSEKDLITFFEAKLLKDANALRLEHGFKFEVEVVCRDGFFNQNLNQIVLDKNVDLVVMGAKGVSNWLDKLLGTTISNYLPEALTPVLAVPLETAPVVSPNIAYAADFENEDTPFLRQLLKITDPLSAQVTIINIQSDTQLNTVVDDQILYEINKQFPDNNFAFAQIQEHNIVAGLEAFTAENNMQVLAISLRKRNLFESIFHSSISQALGFRARVPLLILPELSHTEVNNRLEGQKAEIV